MKLFKKNPPLSAWLRAAALAFSVGALASQTSKAQIIYSNTFNTDDSANWAVNYSDLNGSGNSWVNFNFDYTAVGLPIAPHSALLGSSSIHHGLLMSPDYKTGGGLVGSAAVPGVSCSPLNFSITANFDMHADMWINYNGSLTPPTALTTGGGGSSSTILYGCGYGTAGTTACVAGSTDAILVGTTTDTGSSAQMRMYGPSAIGQASYQNGTYPSTGTASPSYPGEPFVYNNPSGTRAFEAQATWNGVASPNWTNWFPSTQPPAAQVLLYHSQTNIQCNIGALDFGWHDVEVQKIGTVINYLIDGHLAASANYSSAGTPAGPYLVFNAFDINTGASTDPNYTNVNFVVFANIVVSNLANVVNLSVPTASCSEAAPDRADAGVFTLTRSSTESPLTVNYILGGTATNGHQYSIVGGTATSVTFAAGDLTTNIYIVPIDDGIPSVTRTVILSLQSGAGYAAAGNGVVSILDNDPVTIDISGGSQAYGRYTVAASAAGYNDYMNYTLTRRGKLTIGSDLTVNVAYSGSAVAGTDFTPVSSFTIPDGVASVTNQVAPLDNASVTTNRSVIASVVAGANYAIGTGPATNTVVSAHYAAPFAVLLSDPLTGSTAPETNNWKITYGCGDLTNDTSDYQVDFGMNLASAAGGITIPAPPNGNANALHLTCNKDISPGSAGAVNVYYTNLWLSGNYAVRFNMNVIEGQTTATATEGVMFGVNHTGTCSNWWYGSGPTGTNTFASDGIWYYMTAQPAGSAAGDYQEFTGLGRAVNGVVTNTGWTKLTTQAQAAFAQVFKDTPGAFTCLDGFGNQTAGVPAEGSPAIGYDASTWSDVEIKQTNNIVTLSINHTLIFAYTNTTAWTNGYLMLGYADPYGTSTSIGSPEAGAYFANLQVVQLSAPTIKINSIAITGGNAVIKFTSSSAYDTTASFTLQSSGLVKGTYNNVSPAAAITSLGSNQFQATVNYSGGQQFYRIQHN